LAGLQHILWPIMERERTKGKSRAHTDGASQTTSFSKFWQVNLTAGPPPIG
jgi:hypothetical protein